MKLVFIIMSLVFLNLNGSEDDSPMSRIPHHTYQRTPITRETLPGLLPKPTPELVAETQQFIQDYKFLFKQIRNPQNMTGSNKALAGHCAAITAAFAKFGVKNYSTTLNYVFRLPSGHFLKVPGLETVRENYNQLLSLGFDHELTYDELESIPDKSTYHSPSHAANYLLYNDIISWSHADGKFPGHWKSHNTVPTYLIPATPQDAGKPICDSTHVIVQQEARGKPMTRQQLVDRSMTGIGTVLVAGIWNVNAENFFVDEAGAITPVDLAPPPNSNPNDFFNKHRWRFKLNCNTGFKNLNREIARLKAQEEKKGS